MRRTNFNPSKDIVERRKELIDELLDGGFTPEQIKVMAQSREEDKQKKKEKETEIAQLEDEIRGKFEAYIHLLGVKDIEVEDLELDILFNIIKGEVKTPFEALTREEKMKYQAIADELWRSLRDIGVEI